MTDQGDQGNGPHHRHGGWYDTGYTVILNGMVLHIWRCGTDGCEHTARLREGEHPPKPRSGESDRPKRPETPTLDRLMEVHDRSQAIGEFLQWLEDRGYVVAMRGENGLEPVPGFTAQQALRDFFQIDPTAEARELEAVTAYLQARREEDGR